MKYFTATFLLSALIIFTSCKSGDAEKPKSDKSQMKNTPTSVYDFTMKLITGEDQPLKAFEGKVLLIVNVASECGYTPQYKDLQAAWLKYKDQGLVILGFPANEFGGQEPGTNAEIETFCEKNYGVTFPLFEKIVVKGDGTHPLYEYLTHKDQNGVLDAEVKWNFNKFLIDRHGRVVQWYKSSIKPADAELQTAIEAELGKK